MHFFLVDFALAFVALLGYRAVATVTRDRVAAMALEGRLYPQPAFDPETTRRDKGLKSTMACCGERGPHRLINFW
jgi:hypothetical protein